MGIKAFIWKKFKWKLIKNKLGYNENEMKVFHENLRNREIIERAPEIMNWSVIAEVIQSHGCNSGHHVGDKFYFDGFGNLIIALSTKKICLYALHAITPQIFAACELIYANADPNQMRFKQSGCFDVGLECGGFGHIVMKIRAEKIKES